MEAGQAHETESRVYKTGKVSGLCCPKCITKMKRERVLLLEFLKGNQKVTKGCRGRGNVFSGNSEPRVLVGRPWEESGELPPK